MEEITEEQEKRIAISTVAFPTKMLKQKHEQKDIFRFSAKGKRHPISKLKENPLKLIESAYHGPTTESVKQKILLVGKRVKHKFQNDVYFGRVISVVPGFVNFYNIVYDNDVAEDGVTKCVYTYKLLEDYKNGDLEIVLEVTAWWKFKVVGCRKQCLISTFNTVHAEAHFLKSLFLFSVVCL